MKIQLKNIKVCEWASEETTCFDATIYLDGKKAGWAKNDGRGGSTLVDFSEPGVYATAAAWAKTLPPKVYDTFEVPMDLEHYVDGLLEDHIEAKQAAKIAKTAAKEKERFAKAGLLALQLEFGGTCLWVGIKAPESADAAVTKMAAKYKFNPADCKRTIL